MKTKQEIQKNTELWALNAARSVCSTIPVGKDVSREEPDFLITDQNGSIAIETTELLIPALKGEFPPVQEEDFHKKLVKKAEGLYRQTSDVKTIEVSVRFNNGKRNDMQKMALALVEFISRHSHLANPVATFYDGLPEIFFSVTIIAGTSERSWLSHECCGYTVDDVYEQLALRISEKNKRLPTYHANLPNIPVWLLIYTTFDVSRSMSIPHGIEQWKQPFGFERVLFYSCLDESVVEILPL